MNESIEELLASGAVVPDRPGSKRLVPAAQSVVVLPYDERSMLEYLADVEGADVWDRPQAGICRALEGRKLVRIVKAKNAPKDGAARQPYFGVKITRAGMKAIGHD